MEKATYIFLIVSEVLIFTVFFLGGVGYFNFEIEQVAIVLFGFLVILGFTFNKKLLFPQGSLLYLVFLGLLALNVYSKPNRQGDNYGQQYLLLFASGGLIWLFSYNFREKLGNFFENLVLVLAGIFGALFIVNSLITKIVLDNTVQFGLFLPYTSWHNHVGDIWAIAMVILAARVGKGKKLLYFAPLILGLYFLFESLSRSAYLTLAGGVFYLFLRGKLKDKKVIWGMVVSLVLLFVATGFYKTTFFSRPYFVEAILGIVNNPWGVGMGNFIHTAQTVGNEIFGENVISFFTHNLILEILVGMGILGVSFILWILWACLGIFEEKRTALPSAILFALFINFLFDTTYFVPTMLWLWFMALGLSQTNYRSSVKNVKMKVRSFINKLGL